MRRILTFAALTLFLSGCGDRDTQSQPFRSQLQPFPFTFAGPCSGNSLASPSLTWTASARTACRASWFALTRVPGPIRSGLGEDGILHRQLSAVETSPSVTVRVLEVSQDYDWHHRAGNVVREWVAESGQVDLRLSRSETDEQECWAQVALSDMCFVSPSGEQRRTIHRFLSTRCSSITAASRRPNQGG